MVKTTRKPWETPETGYGQKFIAKPVNLGIALPALPDSEMKSPSLATGLAPCALADWNTNNISRTLNISLKGWFIAFGHDFTAVVVRLAVFGNEIPILSDGACPVRPCGLEYEQHIAYAKRIE